MVMGDQVAQVVQVVNEVQVVRVALVVALLNLSVLGFSFVDMFHDKAKRTQQGNLLHFSCCKIELSPSQLPS